MLADLPSCDGTATATAGRAAGRPRVKVTTVPEMMALIREGRGG